MGEEQVALRQAVPGGVAAVVTGAGAGDKPDALGLAGGAAGDPGAGSVASRAPLPAWGAAACIHANTVYGDAGAGGAPKVATIALRDALPVKPLAVVVAGPSASLRSVGRGSRVVRNGTVGDAACGVAASCWAAVARRACRDVESRANDEAQVELWEPSAVCGHDVVQGTGSRVLGQRALGAAAGSSQRAVVTGAIVHVEEGAASSACTKQPSASARPLCVAGSSIQCAAGGHTLTRGCIPVAVVGRSAQGAIQHLASGLALAVRPNAA